MLVKVPIKIASEVQESTKDEWLKSQINNSKFKKFVELDGLQIDKASLKEFYKLTKDKDTAYSSAFQFLYSASKNRGGVRIHSMSEVRAALISLFNAGRIKGYLFTLGEHRAVLPYLISAISDSLRDSYGYSQRYSVPSVTVSLANSSVSGNSARTRSFVFDAHVLTSIADKLELEYTEKMSPRTKDREPTLVDFNCEKGIPVEELMRRFELFTETQELHDLYDEQINRFLRFLPMYGKQFRARGLSLETGWYSIGTSLYTEGKPGRVILDTLPNICFGEDVESKPTNRRVRWSEDDYVSDNDSDAVSDRFSSLEDLDLTLDKVTINDLQQTSEVYSGDEKQEAPLHPTMTIFHLEKQRFFNVHVNNIAPYKYKDDISQYLILPDEVKILANMLVGGNDTEDLEDIIEGKSQSTVITCIGDPGVGKTLLAEVISEACKKPLYKVPADQLGADAQILERNLVKILRRAERWGAVLMIDEANAYVHARGIDITQNAIVGVFLRRIEYFKGTLILTTNQTVGDDETVFDIDDAILSRSDAVIRLNLPTKSDAKKIWRVQAKLFGAEDQLTKELVEELGEKYTISGRSIRKLLKNALRWAAFHKHDLSIKDFEVCAKFIPFTQHEAKSKASS